MEKTINEMKRNLIVGFFFYIAGLFILWFFSDNLGYTAWIVSLLATPFFILFRFLFNKYYVFKVQDDNLLSLYSFMKNKFGGYRIWKLPLIRGLNKYIYNKIK